MDTNPLSRYRGALFGLAAGDALGTTVEFSPPGSFQPVTDIVGGGTFGLSPGEWTDDTSMALCLAESLIACGGFEPADQMARYLRWCHDGHLSSNGHCFDIGNTTSSALRRYEETGEPFAPAGGQSAGNGCLMRLAPVPLAFATAPAEAVRLSGESARTTHGARACIDACRYYGGLIAAAVGGVDKATLLAPRFAPVPGLWQAEPLCAEVDTVAAGSFKELEPPAIAGAGYVVKALEAALWAFDRSDTFADGARLAVNLGDDADTTGAIYGQLAGAYYGFEAIPAGWREVLALGETILTLADGLACLAGGTD